MIQMCIQNLCQVTKWSLDFEIRNIQFQSKESVVQYRASNRSEKLHQIYLKQLFVLRCRAIIEFERFLF